MYEELRQAWATLTAPGAQFEVVEVPVRGQSLHAYKNAPPDLRTLWQLSAGYGDRDYLVYGDERRTFERAHREVASIANWLLDHGVEPGDRVAIAMRNYPEWMLSYWACVSIGVVAVGMNAWWTGPELQYGIQDSNPSVIIADAERLDRLAAHTDEIDNRILVGVRLPEPRPDVVPFADLCAGPTTLPEVSIDPDADACIFYTSGTTGRPKGAQLTHRGCANNVMTMAFANTVQAMASALAAGEEPNAGPPAAQAPIVLVVTPLFHVTANNCIAHMTTLAGGTLVHMYKWDAGEALRLIETELAG